ncbi:MAG: LysM peptidoglycan-binding domain-containing protein [Chloroflexi bacterium]|nr:LysM peptidoglycan-binding domain-containing protein [Chloroflexota bacterium]
MTSSWIPQQRSDDSERPWMGMAMLAALPLLSLILIRMLWSGSSLWFLTVGIILLGAAAVVFLARRPQEQEYGRQTLAQEQNRVPLVLTGLGILFLAMLLLPNFAGGSEDGPAGTTAVTQSDAAVELESAVSGIVQPPAQSEPIADVLPAVSAPSTAEQSHVIAEGDTLWDIATTYGVEVDAIVAANADLDPTNLLIGQEIVIPAASAGSTAEDAGVAAAEEDAGVAPAVEDEAAAD